MTTVTLHMLSGSKKALEACRLIEGLYLDGKRLVVYFADAARAAMFDGYLWTFAQHSFVPHVLWAGQETPDDPVVLVTGPLANPNRASVLVVADRLDDAAGAGEFDEVHDLAAKGPEDEGKRTVWEAAGFTVSEVAGVTGRRS